VAALFQLLRRNQSDHQKYEEHSDAYEEQHFGDFRRADGDTGKSLESRDGATLLSIRLPRVGIR
jgi:hypothetical protein